MGCIVLTDPKKKMFFFYKKKIAALMSVMSVVCFASVTS